MIRVRVQDCPLLVWGLAALQLVVYVKDRVNDHLGVKDISIGGNGNMRTHESVWKTRDTHLGYTYVRIVQCFTRTGCERATFSIVYEDFVTHPPNPNRTVE